MGVLLYNILEGCFWKLIMNEEDHILLRRILLGQFYFDFEYQNKQYLVKYKDPTIDIISMADYYYLKEWNENKGIIPTLDETLNILRSRGLWTDRDDFDFKMYPQQIEQMEKQISGLKFKKSAQRALIKKIENVKNKFSKLLKKKHAMAHLSLEFYCAQKRNRYIVANSCSIIDAPHLLNDISVIDNLSVLIDRYNSQLTDKRIRKFARNQPFRGMWIATHERGNRLFNHSMSEMTDLQSRLVNWALIYDYAYNHTQRPPDSVIDNDELFDSWYANDIAKNEKESQASYNDIGNAQNAQVFIPADAEGAKEVYDLNSIDAREKIRLRRNKLLKHKEPIKEEQMPDTRRQLQMDINKMQTQRN